MNKNREATGEAFKVYLNALPETPNKETLASLSDWIQELETLSQLEATSDETLDEIDLAELKKSEYRILYLDFLFMLYFIDNKETLQEAEHVKKFKEKLTRLYVFFNTLKIKTDAQ